MVCGFSPRDPIRLSLYSILNWLWRGSSIRKKYERNKRSILFMPVFCDVSSGGLTNEKKNAQRDDCSGGGVCLRFLCVAKLVVEAVLEDESVQRGRTLPVMC